MSHKSEPSIVELVLVQRSSLRMDLVKSLKGGFHTGAAVDAYWDIMDVAHHMYHPELSMQGALKDETR
jgi:hypothetical protein